ncbi:alpha/beta hydrolase-fold protein [Leeuwenhoekiella sp. A16]|uniref:alpha/beta hydrolase-fold protein n=1 Tax=unclassified Leeuwenhoekiella TaxID=2615029 RepID=UPI003A7FFEF6
MKAKLSVLLILFLIVVFQNRGNAQKIQEDHFLQKEGVLDSLYSKVLNENREIYIQMPASYTAGSQQKYPVIYILDGEVFLPTVTNVLDFYSGGFMPEMVVVGISNRENRVRDLTTSPVTTINGMPFNLENGQAANFFSFIEDELVPYIEQKYPVTQFRTLIGHSYGGLFTIYSLLEHKSLFANYIAIDPSLDWDKQKMIHRSKEVLSAQNFNGKSLFVSLGGQLNMQDPNITIENVMQDTTDFTLFARSNIMFSEFVRENQNNQLSFNWKFYQEELHGTIAFPSIKDGLIAVFKWFQMENTDKFNSPDTPIDELTAIINYRADKLKKHFGYAVPPYPEDLLNMLGYMSMDMEQPEKSKMFFEFGIKYYPASANAYDSMADYYEASIDYVNALKYVSKAFEISGSDNYRDRIEKLKQSIHKK